METSEAKENCSIIQESGCGDSDGQSRSDRTVELLKELTLPKFDKLKTTLQDRLHYEGRVFDQARLVRVDFRGVNLFRASIYQSHLKHVDLSEADLSEAVVIESDLSYSNLEEADLSDIIFWKTDCSSVNFNGALFLDAFLIHVALRDANLCGADLTQATLDEVDLHQAIYDSETLWPEGFNPIRFGARLVDRRYSSDSSSGTDPNPQTSS